MDTERAPHNSKWYRYATTPKIVKMFRVRGYDVTGFTSEDGGYKTQIEGKYYGGRFYFNFEYFTELQNEQVDLPRKRLAILCVLTGSGTEDLVI